MRGYLFAKRNAKEILREPLSYVFCLGLPMVMLVIFQVIHQASGGMTYWFELPTLTPGILVFAYGFIMLYMTLLVSKDRSTCFLTRLFTSPMTTLDFVLGYAAPGVVLALLQSLLCYLAALLIGLIGCGGQFTAAGLRLTVTVGYNALLQPVSGTAVMHWGGMLLSVVYMLPTILFFVGLGILFGTLFNEKSAPGLTSGIISVSTFFSGIFMNMESMAEGFRQFCRCLPFYPATTLAQDALALSLTRESGLALLTVCLYALAAFAAALPVFRRAMKLR